MAKNKHLTDEKRLQIEYALREQTSSKRIAQKRELAKQVRPSR